MTVILLTSSVTMQWATMRIRKGDRTGMNRAIAAHPRPGRHLPGAVGLRLRAAHHRGRLRHRQRRLRHALLHPDRVPRRARHRRRHRPGGHPLARHRPASSARSTTWRWRPCTTTGTSWTWSGSCCSSIIYVLQVGRDRHERIQAGALSWAPSPSSSASSTSCCQELFGTEPSSTRPARTHADRTGPVDGLRHAGHPARRARPLASPLGLALTSQP